MKKIQSFLCIAACFLTTQIAFAKPKHGISMYGEPALGVDFTHLPYANPDAPRGGRIIFGESGGFDSLNPYILKGRAPWGVRAHMVESLMGRSYGEPFALYGLLAETIETGPNREWVEFVLRKEAAFSDNSPVTVDDVIWSIKTLGEQGHPRYANSYKKIETIEQTGARSLRVHFNTDDKEAALIVGLHPILKRADWEGRDFTQSGLQPFLASGPYVLGDFEVDRFISFKRNPQYWGNNLPFNKGRHNLDDIRYEFFSDASVIFEAFKAGETSLFIEGSPERWQDSYNFPRAKSGAVVKSIVANQRPSGISGFVMNTRRDLFQDWRVREALIQAFNFEFINQTLNNGENPRITSYFSNSVLAMRQGAARDKVAALLAPFGADLLPDTLEGYVFPISEGTVDNRKNLRKAKRLLAQAGWTVQDGILKNATGEVFEFEFILRSGSTEMEAVANIYADALSRLGIQMHLNLLDSAQMKERTNRYDFDMTYYRRALSLSPGNEQRLYWGSEGVTKEGTRNWMGVASPAIDGMIDTILASQNFEDFIAATRALDRVLTAGRYVIPIWYSNKTRMAHDARLNYPMELPIYGYWSGFIPDVFWYE